jgi:hypothetical protein
MRCISLIALATLFLSFPQQGLAQVDNSPIIERDISVSNDESLEFVAPDSPTREEGVQLQRERFKTALAKERAEQAFQEDRARLYEYQVRTRETYSQRMEQERHYDKNRDEISTIGQTAGTIASIVRQVQVLSGGGW